jgi:hypothetical protein
MPGIVAAALPLYRRASLGGLTWKVKLPAPYIVANYLKLIAGAGGGLTAQWLLRTKIDPTE